MIRLFALLFILMGLSAPLAAQTSSFASLKADRITYVSGYKVVRATGHVEIIYGTTILTANELIFDAQNDLVQVQGPLRLQDGDNVTIVADYAELSGDLKRGILKSARMVLNQQLQISAVEINRSEGQITQLFKAAASSCTVTLAHPTPFWQIRAKRIVHDEAAKRLYFENAQVRLASVPVAYLPRLSLPGPSVRRANGFLVPGISNSDTQGTGLYTPYFITLGDYADVTLTPHLYSSGTATLGYDFRKRFRSGALDLTGAVTRDSQTGFSTRAYLFADGNWKSPKGLRTDLKLELTSDATYLSDHGISDKTRLESHLRLGRTTRQSNFTAGFEGFRTISSTTPAATIPYLMGEVSIRRRWSPGLLGGQAGLSLATNSYERQSTVNGIGRDGVRVSSRLDWGREWLAASGMIFATRAELLADYYSIRQHAAFASPITRVTPIAAAELRLPLVRNTDRATQVIEPRLQLVWSRTPTTPVPDEDSTQVEFDASNLFSLNRFSGIDRIETGLRANIGVTYSRRSLAGWNIDAVVGKVVRLTDLGQFAAASGLAGTGSSYVMAGQVTLPSKLHLNHRMVFDEGMNVSKNETGLGFRSERITVDTSYLWLTAGAAGNATNRSEWSVNSGFTLADHWRTRANLRYDLLSAIASDTELALTYSNDCIKVDFSLSRRFVSSSNVTPSTSFGMQVTLAGFGARANSDAYGRKCSDF